MLSRISGFLAALAGFMILSCVAFGQVTTGTILGTVNDSTGAVVSGASVTITDVGKGSVSRNSTDASGNYNVPFLIPGTYKVVVEKPGFKSSVSNNVILDVDQKARVDFALQIGQVSQQVEVTAAAPLIRLDSAELGEVIAKRQVQALPLNGRNFAQLVYLVPGVTPGQAGENLSGSSSFNPRAASDFNALGSQANANEWLVDGIDDNEWTFNTVMVQPSVESIGQFKVLTGTYSAEFGRGAGVISVSTRSGSNEFHGEVFDYLRNSWMDARNYFNPPTQLQPAYRRNQFGAAVGGPIKKDKLFFFADYYGQRSLKGIVNLNSVPTDAERAGDFSNYRNSSGQLITIYNPFTTTTGSAPTRQAFPNNIIPANLLSQVGLNVASIYPEPQIANQSFNNYTSAANQLIDDNGGNARIDYRLGDKDSMFGRFSYERFIQTAPNPLVGGQGTCCLATPASAAKQFDLGPQVAGVQNTNLVAQGLSLNETHLFSSRLLNEFRTGYARINPFTFQSDYGHQSATSLGIMGVNVTKYATGLPNIQIGGSCGSEFTCIQGGQAFLPANPLQTNIQIEDALSWTKGTHQLKFGFRYIHQMSSPFTNTTTRGQFTFNDNFTNNPQDVAGTLTGPNGSGLAALLLGFPNSGSRNYLQQPDFATDGEWDGFVQDDWKATPQLTLNLGVRYDVFTPEVVRHDRMANFDWNTLAFVFPGNGTGRHVGMQTRYNNFSPRLGFAYDLNGKGTTVVRGGYGIAFFPLPYSGSDELGQNPPFTVSQTFNENTNPPGTQYADPCTPNNLGSACLTVIDNPFPQGVTTIPVSTLTNTALLNASGAAIVSHQMSNPTPNMQTWNLDVERQLHSGLLEVAYAGSHTIHMTYAYNPNEVQPGPTSTASRRLIQPLNNISTWVEEDEINASNYNALQAKYTERYSHGLTALIAYTYSKSLDYGGSAASGGGSAGNPQTITCLKCGYGASGFDQKHRFVGSVAYELPFGVGKPYMQHGVGAWALGGWEADGIITLGTGNPFTVTLNTGVNNGAPSWPNRIGPGKISNPGPNRWFNTADFVPPPDYTYGNSARSVLYGPGIANADLSLQRTIRIKESLALQLRGDAFNSFNHPNFLNPNAAIGSPTAGVISGTNLDNRDMQVSAKIVF